MNPVEDFATNFLANYKRADANSEGVSEETKDSVTFEQQVSEAAMDDGNMEEVDVEVIEDDDKNAATPHFKQWLQALFA